MQDLVFQLRQLATRNRDGSLTTQADRKRMLTLIGTQLVALGYRSLRVEEFRGRHVNKLLTLWTQEGLSVGTIDNRLACLRWMCEKVGRAGVMAHSNEVYGIQPRTRVAPISKARTVPLEKLGQIKDAYVQQSLRLILAYGLRRKEALLIRVWEADRGQVLGLQGSWCKNGRPRDVPILLPFQRDVLEEVKTFVGQGGRSLIPDGRSYIQQRHRFDYWVRHIGLRGAHALRHAFAQETYRRLTGMEPPLTGGLSRGAMSEPQWQADQDARALISEMLGHNRLDITDIYLGVLAP